MHTHMHTQATDCIICELKLLVKRTTHKSQPA